MDSVVRRNVFVSSTLVAYSVVRAGWLRMASGVSEPTRLRSSLRVIDRLKSTCGDATRPVMVS
jgi:hypothetical protein